MLNDFEKELAADNPLNSKHVPYYIHWIRDCYNFFVFNQPSGSPRNRYRPVSPT